MQFHLRLHVQKKKLEIVHSTAVTISFLHFRYIIDQERVCLPSREILYDIVETRFTGLHGVIGTPPPSPSFVKGHHLPPFLSLSLSFPNNCTIYPKEGNKYIVWMWQGSERIHCMTRNIPVNTLYRENNSCHLIRRTNYRFCSTEVSESVSRSGSQATQGNL